MMTRYNRSKLRAHDQGVDRHNKGTSWLKKQERIQAERLRLDSGMRRRRKAPKTAPVLLPEPPPPGAEGVRYKLVWLN